MYGVVGKGGIIEIVSNSGITQDLTQPAYVSSGAANNYNETGGEHDANNNSIEDVISESGTDLDANSGQTRHTVIMGTPGNSPTWSGEHPRLEAKFSKKGGAPKGGSVGVDGGGMGRGEQFVHHHRDLC